MIKFIKSLPDSQIKKYDHIYFVAPEAYFKANKGNQKIAKIPGWDLLKDSISSASKIKKYKNLSTFTGAKSPNRLQVTVLTNKFSRGASPSNKEWIYQALSTIDSSSKSLVIFVLDQPENYIGAVSAVSRCLRSFSLKTPAKKDGETSIISFDTDGEFISADKEVVATSESTRWVCELVDRPPSDLNPKAYSQNIKSFFKGSKNVSIKEISGKKLVTEKLMGIYSVGKAAVEDPRALILDYNPPKSKKIIGLVGKGLTYDTGGLNIKVGSFMTGMKMDLGGSAAIVGAFNILVKSGFNQRVVAVLGIAENAIGPEAYKPDDVIKMHSGKTVEINNTDAEGRLVLADCMSYICGKYKPQYLIDAATLTGAQLVATGLKHAAIISNDENLESSIVDSGKTTGDLICPLPFAPEFFMSEFDSQIADMTNSVKNRANAQTSCAAQFLYSHIEKHSVKWAHIDLAGPSMDQKGLGTGFGASLIANSVLKLK